MKNFSNFIWLGYFSNSVFKIQLIVKYFHRYKILSEFKLNLQVYSGVVTLNAMFDSMNELIHDKDYQESNHGLVDFREAELRFNDEELDIFLGFLQELKITKILRRVALLTNTPNQVTFVTIFSHLAESSTSIDYKVFSTFKGAMSFLQISINNYSIVDSFLTSLSKSGR